MSDALRTTIHRAGRLGIVLAIALWWALWAWLMWPGFYDVSPWWARLFLTVIVGGAVCGGLGAMLWFLLVGVVAAALWVWHGEGM